MKSDNRLFNFARTLNSAVSMFENRFLLQCLGYSVLTISLLIFGISVLWSTILVFAIFLALGGWRFSWMFLNTVIRDLRAVTVLIRTKIAVRAYLKKNGNMAKIFQENVKKYPNKTIFIYEDMRWTFKDVDEITNSIANFFHETGVRQFDVVALYIENHPSLAIYWLALSKIGVIGALVNYNLREESLAHCINISAAKAIVFSPDLAPYIHATGHLFKNNNNLELYSTGLVTHCDIRCLNLELLLQKSPTYPPPETKINFRDPLMYVYTSGTTGMPKAAVITHTRYFYMAYGLSLSLNIRSDDIIYNPLPLYHTAGGMLGIGQALIGGSTVVVRKKFSASQFWKDCAVYNCTIAQYIGEICRYLLAQPVRPDENKHRVRLMFGNGLRPQIWADFQKRFGVKQMGEFYGATEGNCNIVNMFNKVGAVGFTTRILPIIYPVTLIRVDESTGEPIRDKRGICIKAQPGEPGELVGKILRGDPMREFDGYVTKASTDKTIAYDVFKKGDLAFLTGDILIMDNFGYMYFKDRAGDSFRWKGENVSTSEVEGIISNLTQLKDSVVYGVHVPGLEGCAGMAVICDRHLNLSTLPQQLHRCLPPYARPVFIRLAHTLDATGTFKFKKVTLRKQGFNPTVITDPLFYFDTQTQQYLPLTAQIYAHICSGKIKL